MRACVPTWFKCQRACIPAWFTCQRAKSVPNFHFYISTCQCAIRRANVLTWRAKVAKTCQFFNSACQRAKRRANFSNIPLWNAKGNLYTLLLYKKFYILFDIIVITIICICIVKKTCIILHFYTSCHIKEKCMEFFFFIIYLSLKIKI